MAAPARFGLALAVAVATAVPALGQSLDSSALARIDALEAEIRRLTSELERSEFERRQAEAAIRGKLEELDFRVIELEGGDPTAAVAPPATPAPTAPAPAEPQAGAPASAEPTARPGPGAPPAALGVIATEVGPEHREAFNAAARVAEQQGGDAAKAAFEGFLAENPGTPLASEAWRQVGETYAREGRWREAASAYLTGVRDHGAGASTPENLVGLAESLTELGRFEQACSAIFELESRFPAAAQPVRMRARDAKTRAGCP
jgi:TolA-binding protein